MKEKFLDFIEDAFKTVFKNEGTLYHACKDTCVRKRFSLLQTIHVEDINFGLVRLYVTPFRNHWITFKSNLVISHSE